MEQDNDGSWFGRIAKHAPAVVMIYSCGVHLKSPAHHNIGSAVWSAEARRTTGFGNT